MQRYSAHTLQKQSNHEETVVSCAGTVEKVLFYNHENGYTVCRILTTDTSLGLITACGVLASITAGQTISVSGAWIQHPKFGAQLQIKTYCVQTPQSITGIEKYLASGLIKGIGPVYAKRMVDFFGADVLNIIDQDPAKLRSVPGLGEKRVQQIIEAWKDQREISHIMVFLQEKGLSTALATKIYKTYKNQAIEKILENPYCLAEDIWGIGFGTADTLAQQLSIAADSIKRCRAGFLHTINEAISSGHVYIELNELKEKTASLLALDQNEVSLKFKSALHDLYNEHKIKLIKYKELHYLTRIMHFEAEKGCAEKLKTLLDLPRNNNLSELIDRAYRLLQTDLSQKITLHEQQQRAILASLEHGVSIVTGGPGTGKTTLIKALLSVLEQEKVRFKMAAPTGKAAKRMSMSTGRTALTIHRLLEFDPSVMQFTRTQQNALDTDFLIIDESSMIDIFLMNSLLKAIKVGTHVIFIGDVDQLPSVGPGNILFDMIESESIPTTRLIHIFRQAHNSLITHNAHRINEGQFFITHDDGCKQDFFFIKEEDPANIPTHLKKIYHSMLPRLHIAIDDSTVLVPMNRGLAGTIALNHALQNDLNPAQNRPSITYGLYNYRVNDRVMQIKNNYEKLIFNGDTGLITSIHETDKTISVQFDTALVTYEMSELDELTLAYAISVHKSQGSEYASAVIPIFMQHYTLLQRKLLYTAITRAKKLCIIIGQPKALFMAINNKNESSRISMLSHYLTNSPDLTVL